MLINHLKSSIHLTFYHLHFVTLLIVNIVNCRQAQFIQQLNQCTNEEYFNVNQLRCVKCEQTFDHQTDRDYYFPKPFQSYSSNLVLGYQNYSFNSHLAATSLSSNQIEIQTNLERSSDGLSCVCKKGNFRFKGSDLKLVNELICLPCPFKLVSSLSRTTCAFCKKIPSIYVNSQFRGDYSSNGHQNDACNKCDENEILVERLLDSNELVSLNRTALSLNYNFSMQFNLTHLDQLQIQYCVKCPAQTKSINNQCKECHFSFDNCLCSNENGYQRIVSNGVCIVKDQISNLNNNNNQELFKINYTIDASDSDNSLDCLGTEQQDKDNLKYSPFIGINFHSSFSQCTTYHNVTACEQFANLCVLDQYRFKSNRPTSGNNLDVQTICNLYLDINSKMPINYLPQIYFTKDTKDENTKDYLFKILKEPSIEYKLNERLRFHVIAFNANGKFKESRELYLDELFICSAKDQSMDSIVRFAVNVEFKCKIKLSRLFKNAPLNAEDQLFYELYLLLNQTSTTNQTKLIYPIYVLNRNLIKNDQLVNKIGYTLDYFNYYMDHSVYFSDMIYKWQLVKRFFMLEQLSSKEHFTSSASKLTDDRNNQQLIENERNFSDYGKILRYVNRMKLMIRTSTENPNQIYPPLLILDYNQITRQQLDKQSDQTVQIRLDIHFESNEFNLYKRLTIFLAVFCSLIVLLALFRTWAWAKRSNHDNTLNLAILGKFILFNCDYLANTFFVLVLLISVHSFLIYKFQSVVYCFLPSKSFEHFIQLYIILAFCLKSISIVHEFWLRNDIDIFFIDWEKSRSTRLNASRLNSLSNNKEHETADNHLYKYLNGNAGNQSGNYLFSSCSN